MRFNLLSLILDAADLESESAFWSRLVGGSTAKTATHHFVQADGLPAIVIQHAPGHVAPQWPDGAPQQMHFDLATSDPAAADERVRDAGGRRLLPADDVTLAGQQGSRVYASPAGHPFCLRSA
ncbi:hypothetical protein DSC45_19925 [Streptomyces sp. YIM 130001]|uniref:VOC family protein n=1 Tax=Streptomyces sp. YIM 130001 TaxID=2259644 RepID=UPI000E6493B1|nr:VOC family protein [Streptomyces sp. YIM 130001]RII14622.1 hypothetical protein DSC45_19925 [Streptomyces sp. YIM 130001]